MLFFNGEVILIHCWNLKTASAHSSLDWYQLAMPSSDHEGLKTSHVIDNAVQDISCTHMNHHTISWSIHLRYAKWMNTQLPKLHLTMSVYKIKWQKWNWHTHSMSTHHKVSENCCCLRYGCVGSLECVRTCTGFRSKPVDLVSYYTEHLYMVGHLY